MSNKNHPLDILPLKQHKTNKNHKIPYPLPNIELGGFCWLFIAPTASGKTVNLQNVLHNPNFGMKETFDEIIYISPTLNHDPSMRFMKDMDEIVKISDKDSIDNIDDVINSLKDEQDKKGSDKKPILIILDDMATHLNNHGVINQLPQLSRHYMMSFIITFQTFANVPIKVRKNLSAITIFRIYNKKDKDLIEEEIGSEFQDYEKLYNEATKEKFNFLYLNMRDISAWHNYTELLWKK